MAETTAVGRESDPSSDLIATARHGDQAAFETLVTRHRRELIAHCYRFMGSFEEAEDLVQETVLRAWRRLETFEGRAPFRAWLYKIATNACLDALAAYKRRANTQDLFPPSDPHAPIPPPATEPFWIEPFPDDLVDDQPAVYPEAQYDIHESISLAFLAALQHLPGRQRAVLILRDVLGWEVEEIASTLNATHTAVNSALQRARSTLKQIYHGKNLSRILQETAGAGVASGFSAANLLDHYVAYWEAGDTDQLLKLLREDAIITMPPFPIWLQGRRDIRVFLLSMVFPSSTTQPFRLLWTRANGCPAFGIYQRDSAGVFRPQALHILTIRGQAIVEIADFLSTDPQF